MALLPLVAATPKITSATSGSTTASRRGDGAITLLFKGNTQSGSRVDRITAFNMGPEGASILGHSLRLYITDANGNNPRLFREQLLPAYGVAETTSFIPSESVQWTFPSGLVLGTNSCIYVGQGTVGSGVTALYYITNWICEGYDFQ